MQTKKIINDLQKRNFRITKARREIINIFFQARKPLSAKEIYKKLTKKHVIVDLTTVYRELLFLLENDYLKEVHLRSNERFFELANLAHHHHLICDKCGKVDDIDGCFLQNLDKIMGKGFLIKRHVLEFYGLCAECRGNYGGQ